MRPKIIYVFRVKFQKTYEQEVKYQKKFQRKPPNQQSLLFPVPTTAPQDSGGLRRGRAAVPRSWRRSLRFP
jgi:hypothetical protein